MKKPPRVKSESAATKATSPAPAIPAANPWDHWWLRSPFMAQNEYGHYAARPGAEFWYDHYWEPRLLSAWTYELVRRLPKLKLRQPELSAQARELLRSLPPYPQLTSTQKRILSAAMASQFKSGMPDMMLGNTAGWQRGQIFKLGDWRQVEALDRPALVEGDESRKLACSYIRRYWPLIRSAWMLMQSGTGIVHSEKRPPHKLSDCQLRHEQLAEMLRAVL